MSNVTPQTPDLNQGPWKKLEQIIAKDWAQRLGDVWVITGSIRGYKPEKIGDEIEISKSRSHRRDIEIQLERNNYIETIVDISYESGNRVCYRIKDISYWIDGRTIIRKITEEDIINSRFEILDL